jgi:predicted RNA-binding protein with PUA-like domain
MKHWLIKSEPYKYSWQQFEEDGETYWDGVRNYAARLNLRGMEKGDICLFYHSNEGKEIVGLAEVTKEAYQDPTTDDDRWCAVDVKVVRKLKKPVTLKEIKAHPELSDMDLVRLTRLSVGKVKPEEFEIILKMAES